MNTSAIVSISTLFSGKSKPIPENSSELGSTAVAAISGDQDIKNLRISRLIPNIVGRQLESKIVVCSTEDGNYAILTVPEYRQSEHVNGVLKSLQDRYPKKSVSVHTASPVTLMSLAKSSTETKDVATRAHTNYEMVFESIVLFARKNRASDITLTVHKDSPVSRVSFKIEGKNITPDLWAMPTERMSEILNILWQKVDGGSESFWN
ncbi:hypothetical protein M0K88_004697, partial [Escherichia coli]|nr:hypothetical protein [Escherichia coli]